MFASDVMSTRYLILTNIFISDLADVIAIGNLIYILIVSVIAVDDLIMMTVIAVVIYYRIV